MEQHATPQDVPPDRPDGPGVARLLADLIRHSSSLARNEVLLVKAELSEKISRAGAGAGTLAAAAIFANAALIVLLAAAVIALAGVMQAWLAALIVGAVTALAALILLAKGRRDLRVRSLAPRASVESLRKDARLVRGHLR